MMDEQPRVLVIDDSEISLELMAGVLEDAGIAVITLPGPIGATQAVLKAGIQVLVTDVNMPALPGHNLISLFRGNERTKHIKVVLVSSLPEAQLNKIARESGADGVVQKDHIDRELPGVVKRLLRGQRTSAAQKVAPDPMRELTRNGTLSESLRAFAESGPKPSWQDITEV